MKVVDIYEAQVKRFIEEIRPKEEMRDQIDLGYRRDKLTYFLYTARPDWMDPDIIREYDYAKFRYTKTTKEWKLYWLRASGKWVYYEPLVEIITLQDVLACIKKDDYGCFFG